MRRRTARQVIILAAVTAGFRRWTAAPAVKRFAAASLPGGSHGRRARDGRRAGPLLPLLLASVGLFGPGSVPAQATPANVNLLANPSFEDTAGGGRDERLVPGWNLRSRASEREPALTAEEVAVVDDPAGAHCGRRCLRIQPQKRTVELYSPVPRVRFYEPGLYEVSAWVRGRPGTRGFFGAMRCARITSGAAASNGRRSNSSSTSKAAATAGR